MSLFNKLYEKVYGENPTYPDDISQEFILEQFEKVLIRKINLSSENLTTLFEKANIDTIYNVFISMIEIKNIIGKKNFKFILDSFANLSIDYLDKKQKFISLLFENNLYDIIYDITKYSSNYIIFKNMSKLDFIKEEQFISISEIPNSFKYLDIKLDEIDVNIQSKLKKLYFFNFDTNEYSLKGIKNFINLEILEITNIKINENIIDEINTLKKLIVLSLINVENIDNLDINKLISLTYIYIDNIDIIISKLPYNREIYINDEYFYKNKKLLKDVVNEEIIPYVRSKKYQKYIWSHNCSNLDKNKLREYIEDLSNYLLEKINELNKNYIKVIEIVTTTSDTSDTFELCDKLDKLVNIHTEYIKEESKICHNDRTILKWSDIKNLKFGELIIEKTTNKHGDNINYCFTIDEAEEFLRNGINPQTTLPFSQDFKDEYENVKKYKQYYTKDFSDTIL